MAKLAVGKAPAQEPLPEARPGDQLNWSKEGELGHCRSRRRPRATMTGSKCSRPTMSTAYRANLEVIAQQPFFLGMDDPPLYRAQLAAMRTVVLPGDLQRLGNEAKALAAKRVADANGRIEVVSFVRSVTFDLIAGYFGVADPSPGALALWGSRLF